MSDGLFIALSGVTFFQLLVSFQVYLGLNDDVVYYSRSRKWKYMMFSLFIPFIGPLLMRLYQYSNKSRDVHK